MSIGIEPHALVTALMDDMRNALQAIEAGDYDVAHAVLADRCRPPDPLTSAPRTDAIHVKRVAAQIVEASPAGLITTLSAGMVEITAHAIERQMRNASNPEALLAAVNLAGELGITLAWHEDQS